MVVGEFLSFSSAPPVPIPSSPESFSLFDHLSSFYSYLFPTPFLLPFANWVKKMLLYNDFSHFRLKNELTFLLKF